MKAAFYDELEKISGELQGFTRSGRKPISVEKMLENESEYPSPSEAFGEEKEASAPPAAAAAGVPAKYKALALLGTGAGGYALASRAERDRRLGRQMRLQQMQGL